LSRTEVGVGWKFSPSHLLWCGVAVTATGVDVVIRYDADAARFEVPVTVATSHPSSPMYTLSLLAAPLAIAATYVRATRAHRQRRSDRKRAALLKARTQREKDGRARALANQVGVNHARSVLSIH
jgi:hypothetical protein